MRHPCALYALVLHLAPTWAEQSNAWFRFGAESHARLVVDVRAGVTRLSLPNFQNHKEADLA